VKPLLGGIVTGLLAAGVLYFLGRLPGDSTPARASGVDTVAAWGVGSVHRLRPGETLRFEEGAGAIISCERR
jgi:hypothetical protein